MKPPQQRSVAVTIQPRITHRIQRRCISKTSSVSTSKSPIARAIYSLPPKCCHIHCRCEHTNDRCCCYARQGKIPDYSRSRNCTLIAKFRVSVLRLADTELP